VLGKVVGVVRCSWMRVDRRPPGTRSLVAERHMGARVDRRPPGARSLVVEYVETNPRGQGHGS